MTVIATAANPRFTVSRVDIDRPGPTYTIDTLRDLRAERPDAELFFISGADAIAQILDWKDVDRALVARAFRRRVAARDIRCLFPVCLSQGVSSVGSARTGDLVNRLS